MSSANTAPAKTGRPVLGRGLADLIPDGGKENAKGGLGGLVSALGDKNPIGEEVPLTLLHPNPKQPRTHFDEQALDELADSIKNNGILQPILVRPRPAPLPGYEIVAGERRYRAARKAGLTRVPVIIKNLKDEDTLAYALIENLIREDIGPLETARGFARLMSEFGWTQEQMGRSVGKSRVAVTNSLRLLKLPQEVQEALENGLLSEGHARSLLGGEGTEESEVFSARQKKVFERILDEKLTVRDVERLMKGEPEKPTPAPSASKNVSRETKTATALTADHEALQDRLRDAFGTKVRIHLDASGENGHIALGFFSAEELDGLVERLLKV